MQTDSKKPTTRSEKARSNLKSDKPNQSEFFIAKAGEIEADGDGSKADRLMGRLLKMTPDPRFEKKSPATSKKRAAGHENGQPL